MMAPALLIGLLLSGAPDTLHGASRFLASPETDDTAPAGPIDPGLESDLDALDLPLVLRLVDRPRGFLLFISGDGGWSGLDQTLVEELAAQSISTVAINTLKYFWNEKPPDRVGADLKRLADRCGRDGVPLFAGGYSFGAEVVPVVVDLSGMRDRFAALVLISPGPHASFQMSMLDWLRSKEKPTPFSVLEHLRGLAALPALCLAGEKEDESICPSVRGEAEREVRLLPGAHHYGGDYERVAGIVTSYVVDRLTRRGPGH